LGSAPATAAPNLHAELRHDYGYQGSYPTSERQLRLLQPMVVRDPEIASKPTPVFR
jgi:hypothetical protein